ncbi:MAG TPA: PilZ domain-containing protein [Candidatus Sulfomarinibacteraceae bacterium]|nr:PilZ domain-containing protein [Candidatus Sulfomarinibacteraceae bacterium]
MTNEPTLGTENGWTNGELIEIDLNFASMRQFQAQFSPNLSKDGLFIDTGEPLSPGSVVRFRVILPEDFVFLEGTAVVEWVRPAESLTDGVPGMALRFATLSPQNEELVEQLVQDHVDQGGTPFDLDVRPAPADFPTDALEGASSGIGAPARGETVQEGFRLTIRGAGPSAAEAMQALREAVPSVGAEEHESEIVEAAPHDAVDDRVEEPEAPAPEEPADPPELEWDDDAPAEPAPDDMLAAASGELPFDVAGQRVDDSGTADEEGDEPPPVEPTFLASPSDFDHGPEVLGEVPEDEALGGPAFDVSMPEADDEPDSTPVLPDEGRADVRVAGDDTAAELRPRRRVNRRLAGFAALVILAAMAVLLWPLVGARLSERQAERSAAARPEAEPAAVAADVERPVIEGEPPAPSEGTAAAGAELEQPSTAVGDAGGRAGGDSSADVPGAATAPGGPAEAATDREADGDRPEAAPVVTADREAEHANARPGPAGTLTAVDVAARADGTVVTLEADGSLADGAIALWNLPNPPRVVVRVIGITEDYRPYTIEAGTAEVDRLRIGFHGERRPPELWVVLDVTDPAVEVVDVSIRGATAELLVVRR